MGVSHLAVICTMRKGLLGFAIVSVAFPILICSLIAVLSGYVLMFCGCFSLVCIFCTAAACTFTSSLCSSDTKVKAGYVQLSVRRDQH